MKNEILRNQEGVILVVALLMLLVLTLISLSSISSSIFEINISGNERIGATAFYAAEALLQSAVSQLPNTNAIARTKIGEDEYGWTGSLSDKDSPKDSKYRGLQKVAGFDQTWAFERFQINTSGEALSGAKEVEAGIRYGPISAGTSPNN